MACASVSGVSGNRSSARSASRSNTAAASYEDRAIVLRAACRRYLAALSHASAPSDDLLARFGRPLPAVGFALGIDRLHIALTGEEAQA